jgi:hypothetical protein
MKQTIIILAISILIVSCSAPKEAPPTADMNAIFTEAAATAWGVVTETARANIPTVAPTEILQPTQAAPISTEREWAKNYLGGQESGGVIIEVARVYVGYKSDILQNMPDMAKYDKYVSGWADLEVLGELVFKITNNSGVNVNLYLNQGSVQMRDEQISLLDYAITGFGDDLGGEIYPGVTKIGGLWFGIKRSIPTEITQIIFRANGPSSTTALERLGPDYEIVMDVSQHVWEEYPDELKP